jgi:hypothetical protein
VNWKFKKLLTNNGKGVETELPMSEPENPDEGQLLLHQTDAATVRIEVLYQSDTFWLNQKKIAELFGVDLRTISYHLGEVYASGELSQTATLRRIRSVQCEGDRDVPCKHARPSTFNPFVSSPFRPFVVASARC